jgi:hypothetical protein
VGRAAPSPRTPPRRDPFRHLARIANGPKPRFRAEITERLRSALWALSASLRRHRSPNRSWSRGKTNLWPPLAEVPIGVAPGYHAGVVPRDRSVRLGPRPLASYGAAGGGPRRSQSLPAVGNGTDPRVLARHGSVSERCRGRDRRPVVNTNDTQTVSPYASARAAAPGWPHPREGTCRRSLLSRRSWPSDQPSGRQGAQRHGHEHVIRLD